MSEAQSLTPPSDGDDKGKRVPGGRRGSKGTAEKVPAGLTAAVSKEGGGADDEEAIEVLVEKLSPRTGAVVVGEMRTRGKSIPPPSNYAQYTEVYEQLVWVYAAVFAIAADAAIVTWELLKRGELVKEEDNDPVFMMLENPNEEMTWYDLIEATIIYMELSGNEYWEIGRNVEGSGAARQLYTMRPDRVRVQPRADGKGVESYVFNINPSRPDTGETFPADDVLHYKYFHPGNDWYGLSALSAAAQAVVSERYTIDFNQQFFRNGAAPRGFLSTEQPITPEQMDEIAAEWIKRTSVKRGQGHGTPVLPRGLTFQPLGVSPKDMEFLRQRQYNREEILATFGVPPVKVGLLEHSKYDNYKLQEKAFYRDTIQPKLRKVQGTLNKFLLREFNGEYRFRFLVDPFTAESDKERVQRLEKLFGMGAITPNEIRDEMKLGEHYDDGDSYYVSASFAPVGDPTLSVGESRIAAVAAEMGKGMANLQDMISKVHELYDDSSGRQVEPEDD